MTSEAPVRGSPTAPGTAPTGSPLLERPEGIRLFDPAPPIVRFFDATEEALRSRLAKVTFFRRVFQLDRDWMTRITMLMVLLSVVWGIFGAVDVFDWRLGVTQFALGQPVALSNQELYSSITLHGIRMLFGFAQQLELALFGVITVMAFGFAPRHKWLYYVSALLMNLSLVLMEGPFYLLPQFNDNYFPALGWYFYSPLGIRGLSEYVASPLWYVGWFLLALGTMLWALWMGLHLVAWWRTHPRGGRRLPAFALYVIAVVVLIPVSYVCVLAASAWDLANYVGIGPVDPLGNQILFWFFGHGIVYILFLIPLTAFYFLVPVFAQRPIYSYRIAVAGAILFTIITPLLSIHHLYLTPVPPWAAWTTQAITYLIILPSALTVFTVWMTLKGVRSRDWQWNASALFLALSFGGTIAGGLTGPDNNSPAFDIDLHNTLFIVSHFHTIILLSIAAGGFAIVYASYPLLVGRLWYSPRLARLHFVLSAIGWSGVVVGMDLLGSEGVLRRSLIFPRTISVVDDQLFLTAFVVVAIVAQLPFAANALLTIFRGELLSTQGLTLEEVVRKCAQSTHPRPTVPVRDQPFTRRIPRATRERAERRWMTVVSILLIAVLVTSTPLTLSDAAERSAGSDPPAGTEYVSLVGHQYYWAVSEQGPIVGAFSNLIVVNPGQWVAVNATAVGATEDLYIPFRSLPTVDVEVLPDATSYWLFQAPSVPGVYGAPNAEYNGPWFGQDAAALVVLPPAGGASLSGYEATGGEGDVYDPPVLAAAGTSLVADDEGLFDHSVPGPTLEAAPGPVSVQCTVPFASIGIDNYLVNVTTTNPSGQLAYVESHNDTLPGPMGLYRIDTTGANLVAVSTQPLRVGAPMNLTASLSAGVYLYGLVSPVAYVYDPAGESSIMTGSQAGNVMGLWGVLWIP